MNLGQAGLNDVGYRFYTQNAPEAARVTDGVLDEGQGWYSASGVNLLGDHVRWDSAGDATIFGREDLQLRIAVANLAASTGAGAFIINFLVLDQDNNPIENARVRLVTGINSYSQLTNPDGRLDNVFHLDAASYAVSITKDGYEQTSNGRLDVDADALSVAATMQLIVVPAPDDPEQSTGLLVTRDGQGNAQGNVSIFFRMKTGPADNAGDSYDNGQFEVVSDDAGSLTAPFRIGATYQGKRARSFALTERSPAWAEFTVPDEGVFILPQILGVP